MNTQEQHSSRGEQMSRGDLLSRLSASLAASGLVTDSEFKEFEHRARWLERPMEQLLVDAGKLTDAELRDTLAELSSTPVIRMQDITVEADVIRAVPPRVVATYRILPLRREHGRLVLMADRVIAHDEDSQLRLLLGCPIIWTVCSRRDLSECIRHYYGVGLEILLRHSSEDVSKEDLDIPALINWIIQDAVISNATDIHFEPQKSGELRLRHRVDGVLYRIPLAEGISSHGKAIVSSAKVMAQINIAEKRKPQDGRFSITVLEDTFDVRVSVLPTPHGEALNMRLLNSRSQLLRVKDLGLSTMQHDSVRKLVEQPNGMILFTGPTGSGKTTSLYAALSELNNTERKIITLEDPIEYQLDGITQMQVNPQIDFTFATGLRSVLRHDPDIILIGEIRDRETAEIVISSSLTGHLVLSTLHTNDSVSAVTRLLDMGIEPYLVASSLFGVIAQRLIRRVCPDCRCRDELDADVIEQLRQENSVLSEVTEFYRGRGCPACRFTGYSGRKAIFEVLLLEDYLRSMVIQRRPATELLSAALERGLFTLRQSGLLAVRQGITTVSDVMRVTQSL